MKRNGFMTEMSSVSTLDLIEQVLFTVLALLHLCSSGFAFRIAGMLVLSNRGATRVIKSELKRIARVFILLFFAVN
jgi:hypothetical protein